MVRRAVAVLAAVFVAAPLLAQDGGDEEAGALRLEAERVTAAIIASRLTTLEAGSLGALEKAAARALYGEASARLSSAEDQARRAVDFARQAAEAPGFLEVIRGELARPPTLPSIEPDPAASLAQLEQLQRQAEADLAASREEGTQLKAELSRRIERRGSLAAQLAKLEQGLAELRQQLMTPPPAEGKAELILAQRTRRLTALREVLAERAAIDGELKNYDARRELLPARIDRAARRVELAEKVLALRQERTAAKRREETQRALDEAGDRLRDEADKQRPQVRALALANQELAAARSGPGGVTALLEAINRDLTELLQSLDRLRERSRVIQRKVEAAGLTNAMGLLLRKQRESLPNINALTRSLAQRQSEISEAQFRLITYEEQRALEGDVEAEVRRLVDPERGRLSDEKLLGFERATRELATARRKLLDDLIQEYSSYLAKLIERDSATRRLIDQATEYRRYIEERILWVRSVKGSGAPDFEDAAEAVAWLLSPTALSGWLARWPGDLLASWPTALLWLATIAAALVLRLRYQGRLAAMTAVIGRREDRAMLTLRAAALTVILALPWPLIVMTLAELVTISGAQPLALTVLAGALRAAALPLFALELLRQAVRDQGLAQAHFRWPPQGCRRLRWHLAWFIPVRLVSGVVVEAMESQQQNSGWNDALGRLAFLVGCLAWLLLLQRVLRPSGPMIRPLLRRMPEGWLVRTRFLWFPAAVGWPLVLGVLSIRGYYYTALHLEDRIVATLWLVLGVLAVYSLFMRWLRVTHRGIVAQQGAVEAPAPPVEASAPPVEASAPPVEPAAARPGGPAAAPVEPASAPVEVPAPESPQPSALSPTESQVIALGEEGVFFDSPDMPALNEQTVQLFRSVVWIVLIFGLAWTWSGTVPALKKLEGIALWPNPGSALSSVKEAPRPTETPAREGGEATSRPTTAEGEVFRLSLADGLMALLVFVFTAIAAKDIPALIEIALLQYLPIDAGGRYALTTVGRYIIGFIGFSLGFSYLGISWSSIQWLAAALTFGLAFGLQEVFANFVSGIILLIERPIRVGDVVTVGDLSGTVTRIRIRATTVRNFDRKELILPNKSFVTDKVLNWGLTDTILRIVIPVSIPYGADAKKAHEILMAVAAANPSVLKEPESTAFFMGITDGVLGFELRVFVPQLALWAKTRHDILQEIYTRFSEEGIQIASPQRDLHLRSLEGLDKAMAEAALKGA